MYDLALCNEISLKYNSTLLMYTEIIFFEQWKRWGCNKANGQYLRKEVYDDDNDDHEDDGDDEEEEER